MINEELISINASHSIYVNRLASGLGNKAKPYIDEINSQVAARLAKETGKNLTALRREKLLSDINEITSTQLKEYTAFLNAENKEFGGYESAWQAKSVNGILVNAETVAVSSAIVNSAAKSNLISYGEGTYTAYNQMMRKYWSDNADAITNIVANGYSSGISTREVANQVMAEVGNRLNKTQSQSLQISRTGLTHYGNMASKEYFEANDIIIGTRRVATIDSRTSGFCRSIDQTVVLKSDSGYSSAYAPFHPNAVVKGSMVSTSKGEVAIEDVAVGDLVLTHNGRFMPVTTVMSKPVDSQVLKLSISNNSSISLTNDHPVLLHGLGWKLAGDVNIGDKCFYHAKSSKEIGVLADGVRVENVVISDAHGIKTDAREELISYGVFSSTTGVTSSINLKDGVANQEINNIPVNRNLRLKVDSASFERIKDDVFVRCSIGIIGVGYSDSSFEFNIPTVNGVVCLHSFARCLATRLMSFGVELAPVEVSAWVGREFSAVIHGLLSALGLDSKFYTSLSDVVIAESVLAFNQSHALSKPEMLISNEFDDSLVTDNFSCHNLPLFCMLSVESIEKVSHNDFVYNISVAEDETYFADGVLVHNCRTKNIPEIDARYKQDDDGGDRATNFKVGDKLDPKPVDSTKIYYDDLQRLSASDQDAILGKSLGKAYRKLLRDGGTPAQFAKLTVDDKLNKAYTITELKAQDNVLSKILNEQSE